MKTTTVKRKTPLKRGDPVMVISGGNDKKKPMKGKTGVIRSFVSAEKAIVDGLNYVAKHKKARRPGEQAGKVAQEAPIHVARLMYYVDKLKAPVRLKSTELADGTRVRGYKDPKSGEFVQLPK